MPYDDDPAVLAWFETVLTASAPEIRMRALELLTRADVPPREGWLHRAADDDDPEVRATAVLVAAAIAVHGDQRAQELLESDFASGVDAPDMRWEWEYRFVPCIGTHIPTTGVLVWTGVEDDAMARRLAVLRASAGRGDEERMVPIMVGKRFVNRYIRSPRSYAEALRWKELGRPRLPPR